tara:strand:+ start:1395 stop:2036 length:642 start_codon:yes stop_codon:yes gene_type:complete
MAFYLTDFFTLLLICSTIIFATFIVIDKNRFLLLIEYGINQKYSLIYHRKDNPIYRLFISINTLIMLSILISFYVVNINNGIMSLYLFIKIAIVLTAFYLLKMSIIRLLGIIFEHLDCAKKYYYSYSTNLLFLSLIAFPVILFISYYDKGLHILYMSKYVYCIYLFIFLILKIILLNRLNLFRISFIFYNILYLCALEVIPYLGLLELLELIY